MRVKLWCTDLTIRGMSATEQSDLAHDAEVRRDPASARGFLRRAGRSQRAKCGSVPMSPEPTRTVARGRRRRSLRANQTPSFRNGITIHRTAMASCPSWRRIDQTSDLWIVMEPPISAELSGPASGNGTSASEQWGSILRRYRKSDTSRATRELAITAIPFLLIAYSLLWAVARDYFWLYALLVLPAAGLLVRLFVIQHDCAHYSFFPSRRTNVWVGRLIGVATLTPHDHWRRSHATHHAGSGDLARRG